VSPSWSSWRRAVTTTAVAAAAVVVAGTALLPATAQAGTSSPPPVKSFTIRGVNLSPSASNPVRIKVDPGKPFSAFAVKGDDLKQLRLTVVVSNTPYDPKKSFDSVAYETYTGSCSNPLLPQRGAGNCDVYFQTTAGPNFYGLNEKLYVFAEIDSPASTYPVRARSNTLVIQPWHVSVKATLTTVNGVVTARITINEPLAPNPAVVKGRLNQYVGWQVAVYNLARSKTPIAYCMQQHEFAPHGSAEWSTTCTVTKGLAGATASNGKLRAAIVPTIDVNSASYHLAWGSPTLDRHLVGNTP
jgi:hypothetical protein